MSAEHLSWKQISSDPYSSRKRRQRNVLQYTPLKGVLDVCHARVAGWEFVLSLCPVPHILSYLTWISLLWQSVHPDPASHKSSTCPLLYSTVWEPCFRESMGGLQGRDPLPCPCWPFCADHAFGLSFPLFHFFHSFQWGDIILFNLFLLVILFLLPLTTTTKTWSLHASDKCFSTELHALSQSIVHYLKDHDTSFLYRLPDLDLYNWEIAWGHMFLFDAVF